MKIKTFLLTALLCISAASNTYAAITQNDNGEYVIASEADLRELSDLVNAGDTFENKVITLDKDIEMSSEPFMPIGNSEQNYFAGSFLGNDHTISNLHINGNSDRLYFGMFGIIYTSNIERLTLKDISVNIGHASVNGQVYTGALAGIALDSNIMICRTDGGSINVSETDSSGLNGCTGGLVGAVTGGSISFCGNSAKINSKHSSGGIAGAVAPFYVSDDYSRPASIGYSYNLANITVTSDNSIIAAGGITANNNSGTISTCYNTGRIRANGIFTAGITTANEGRFPSIFNCVDFEPSNSQYTVNYGTMNLFYTNTDAEYTVTGNSEQDSVEITLLDTEKMTSDEILAAINKNDTSFLWAVGIDHPVLWLQANNGENARLYGDVTNDGKLSYDDAAVILKHITRPALLSGTDLECADFDRNGTVDLKDVISLMNSYKFF